jgi:hypothetical protein
MNPDRIPPEAWAIIAVWLAFAAMGIAAWSGLI